MYRIMMIEDDEKIRRIVADTLKKWQYDAIEVTQFDQVLTEFEQTNPHLVLIDINLPVFDQQRISLDPNISAVEGING